MATLALNSGLWVRRLLNSCGEGCAYGGSPFQLLAAVATLLPPKLIDPLW
jgi:hypothetical protein